MMLYYTKFFHIKQSIFLQKKDKILPIQEYASKIIVFGEYRFNIHKID